MTKSPSKTPQLKMLHKKIKIKDKTCLYCGKKVANLDHHVSVSHADKWEEYSIISEVMGRLKNLFRCELCGSFVRKLSEHLDKAHRIKPTNDKFVTDNFGETTLGLESQESLPDGDQIHEDNFLGDESIDLEKENTPSDYDQIREDNIREYGEGVRHLAFLGQLYTDKTHFIFELLQNAEDAKATRIRFELRLGSLEVLHDGRPFNEKDVRGICGVGEGTKVEDLTKIGKFGIGFKSVYAYTSNPEIHSGDEHFRIEHYVRPFPMEVKKPKPPWTTLFIFPFDLIGLNQKIAGQEIGSRLRNLRSRTLLFLQNILEIEWVIPGEGGGFYRRTIQPMDIGSQVTLAGHGQENLEDWLVFERSVPLPKRTTLVKVAIAFRLVRDEKTDDESIAKLKQSPWVVFFPTAKETRLGFLIQGPYRTNLSRENIPPEDEWNQCLIKETAALLVDSLARLKDMHLLTINLLETLPIRLDDFPKGEMLQPIFDAVRNALINHPLLPTDQYGFVSARQAKLARGAELRQLLQRDQLQALYATEQPLNWLSGDITQDKTPDLRTYLMQELGIEEITPDVFARKISSSFIEIQSDAWMMQFYAYLSNQKALWQPSRGSWESAGPIRNKPFIRLSNGSHVTPFRGENPSVPNAYLPSGVASDISTVKPELLDHEQALDFLKKLGIPELDIVEVVIESVLPKYQREPCLVINEEEHHRDILNILIAMKTDSQNKYLRLIKALKETPFLRAMNNISGKMSYCKPGGVYLRSLELETYFIGYNAWFIEEKEGEIQWLSLGIENKPRLLQFKPLLSSDKKELLRGSKYFTREISIIDYMLDGLPHFLEDISNSENFKQKKEKALLLWCFLLKHLVDLDYWEKEKLFNGEYRWFYYSERAASFDPAWLNLVREKTWIPSKEGMLYKPSEIAVEQLPPEFFPDDYLVKRIGFKQDEMLALANKVGLEPDDIGLIRALKKWPAEYDRIKNLIARASEPPKFPEKISQNPERRIEKLQEKIREAPLKEYKERSRSVRVSKGNIDQTVWLRQQYTNELGDMVCQICKDRMPFRNREDQWYFEAVEIFSEFEKEIEENHLALCPLCAAMYKEFVKHEDGAMEIFKNTLINSEEPEVPLRLGELNTSVRFVETHYLDIKTILRAQEE